MGRNYRPPQPPEDSTERTLQRIESLERVNGVRVAGMPWEAEWERHRREYMVERVVIRPSPPPPPRKRMEETDVERR